MALHKNIASQKILVFAWDTVNRQPKTGDANNITAYISKDGGAVVQSNDVNPTEIDATNLKGVYAFDLTQDESNCDLFTLKAVSSTSDVEIDPVIVYTVVRADYKADVSNLDAAVSTRAPEAGGNVAAIKAKTDTIDWTDITFLKDIEGGRWKIINNQMIFYKSDNSTEVVRFNLFDSDGSPAVKNIFDRQRA